MQIETPTFDKLVSDIDELMAPRGMKSEPKCFSHAQLPDDRERVKQLRRAQFKKGGRR